MSYAVYVLRRRTRKTGYVVPASAGFLCFSTDLASALDAAAGVLQMLGTPAFVCEWRIDGIRPTLEIER